MLGYDITDLRSQVADVLSSSMIVAIITMMMIIIVMLD